MRTSMEWRVSRASGCAAMTSPFEADGKGTGPKLSAAAATHNAAARAWRCTSSDSVDVYLIYASVAIMPACNDRTQCARALCVDLTSRLLSNRSCRSAAQTRALPRPPARTLQLACSSIVIMLSAPAFDFCTTFQHSTAASRTPGDSTWKPCRAQPYEASGCLWCQLTSPDDHHANAFLSSRPILL